MASQGKYTVIELSEALSVARTTINDWLARYGQYIDFEMQGRRKIYTDASVEVLKEISALRNSGLSSYEIEAELSKRHPVRGEPQPAAPEKPQETPAQLGQRPSESQHSQGAAPSGRAQEAANAQAGAPQGEEFALVAKRQTDEIARMLGESFQNMARRIEEIERNSSEASARASKRHLYSVALLLAVLALVAAVGAAAFFKLEKVSSLRDELAKADATKTEQLGLLRDNTVILSRQSEDLRKNVEALEKGLMEQRADFEKALQQAKGDSEAAKLAEIARLRDKFAAERLELLKKLEAASADPSAKEALLNELRGKLEQERNALKPLEQTGAPQAGN
jgi:DNA-binding transcriptional MerR regulator